MIPRSQGGGLGLEERGINVRPALADSPARANRGGCREEDLEIRVRKDHRPDVPSIHYDVPARANHGAKPGIDPLADHRHGGDRRDAAGDADAPDFGVDRLPSR